MSTEKIYRNFLIADLLMTLLICFIVILVGLIDHDDNFDDYNQDFYMVTLVDIPFTLGFVGNAFELANMAKKLTGK